MSITESRTASRTASLALATAWAPPRPGPAGAGWLLYGLFAPAAVFCTGLGSETIAAAAAFPMAISLLWRSPG
ncbi:hypothetical protein V8J36_17675 [Frigidibacter sp. MR17.14]|uniref:hypothetical protein n=1 Tax=Frigidibacter sp. MR17.14 TaxID=3126509 RepID=UPI0030130269